MFGIRDQLTWAGEGQPIHISCYQVPRPTLLAEPPYISDNRPSNVSVLENSGMTLPCPAVGTPTPHVNWYKDGYPLTGADVGVRVRPDGALRLDQAQSSDAGLYTCHAQNVAGNTSKDFDVQVLCEFSFQQE